MKILHITYHNGCKMTLDFVAKSLGHEITTQIADWNYNIGHNRAIEIWNKYKDYYCQFDVIITSDTAPLARIFLQNNFTGKLIIWVCNRFDYADQASNDCGFPDAEYYSLIRNAKLKNNVKIFSYTKFEYEYAQKYKNVCLGSNIIKPCAFIEDNDVSTAFPSHLDKINTFFIPSYHNDTIFMNLKEKCDQLNINSYSGRYNGPMDLKGLKGIIHIPYAWSNLALFENWSIGNVYLIPSKDFILQLAKQPNFWWQDSQALGLIDSSEWYLPEHQDLFLYFNDWNHLKEIAFNDEIINNKKQRATYFSANHTDKTLKQWEDAFTRW
jgi:hypothetical protein